MSYEDTKDVIKRVKCIVKRILVHISYNITHVSKPKKASIKKCKFYPKSDI